MKTRTYSTASYSLRVFATCYSKVYYYCLPKLCDVKTLGMIYMCRVSEYCLSATNAYKTTAHSSLWWNAKCARKYWFVMVRKALCHCALESKWQRLCVEWRVFVLANLKKHWIVGNCWLVQHHAQRYIELWRTCLYGRLFIFYKMEMTNPLSTKNRIQTFLGTGRYLKIFCLYVY